MMRKILLNIFLIYISTAAFSQEGASEYGIYGIKLGMTLDKLSNMIDIHRQTLIYENTSHNKASIFIDQYTPAEDHDIEKLQLYFFNDSLYMITIDKKNLKTEEYLDQKYGLLSAYSQVDSLGYEQSVKSWKIDDKNIVCQVLYDRTSPEGKNSYRLFFTDYGRLILASLNDDNYYLLFRRSR